MTFDKNKAAVGVTLFGPLGAVLGEDVTQKIGERKDYSQVSDITKVSPQSKANSLQKDESTEEIAARLAKAAVETSRKAGIIGKNTKANTPIVVRIGGKLFGGTIDTITFTNAENLLINEWKFTKKGAPDDATTRGKWAFQLSAYLYMYKQALEQVKESLETSPECTTISSDIAKWLGLNGENADQWKNDLYKRLDAYSKGRGVKAHIARAFDADGQSIVELISPSFSFFDLLKAPMMLTAIAQ